VLGALLGNYRVLEQLGQGGMGVVYVGRHEALGHKVVVKVLRPEMSRDAEMVQRFFNEAQAAAAIRNPGIVQVFDFGTTPDGRAYITMELLEGETLTERLKQRQLDATECCRIGRQIANALQAAHGVGITHRDLKPDNLFLVPDAEVTGGERVKVLDFGIAKLAGELQGSGVQTRTNIVMGTPSYMAPEQCRGGGAIDPRADIYSLGCILFKMCCGRPPFLGQGAGEIVGAHLHVPPPRLDSLAPEMPAELGALVGKMLEKPPDARPQTMAAVSQALDEILRALGGPSARALTPLPIPPTIATPPAFPAQAGPAPTPTPPSMPVPPPPPEAQAFPSSTTLGASAGMSIVQPRPGPRKLPIVLGGLVIVGAAVAVAIVLATAGPGSTGRSISYDDIAAAPRSEHAIAPPAPAAKIAEGSADEPEIEIDPAATGSEVEAECRKYQADRKWRELEACAGRLQPLDPKLAEELKRAAREGKSAVRLAAVEAALREGNLKRARSELDLASPDAPGYAKIKARYAEAEDRAIAALAVQLDRVKDSDCEEYQELLEAQRAAQPPRVAAEAAVKTPCVSSRCSADALTQKASDQLRASNFAGALASYEQAIACRPDSTLLQKAFIVACDLRSAAKAKAYWKRLSPALRTEALPTCVRNGITEDQLNAR
jgi:serine/threonine protein kinase